MTDVTDGPASRQAVPRRLHYCWFGAGDPGPLVARCIESWSRHASDLEWRRWSEADIPSDAAWLHALLRRRRYAFVADWMRLWAVHEEGGVYLDCDMELVRPLGPLLDGGAFIGEEWPGRVNTAALGAPAGHPFVAACMAETRAALERGDADVLAPEIATRTLERCRDTIRVLPPPAFYPYNPYVAGSAGVLMYADVTDETWGIHHWNRGWSLPLHQRVVRGVRRLLRRGRS